MFDENGENETRMKRDKFKVFTLKTQQYIYMKLFILLFTSRLVFRQRLHKTIFVNVSLDTKNIFIY